MSTNEPVPGEPGREAGPERDGGTPWVGQGPGSAPSGQQPQYGQYGQPAPQFGQQPPAGQQYGQYGQQQPTGPQPPMGQYGQPAPRYGQYGAGMPYAPVPQGYGAAQPGIVPLRPINVGEILDGAFRSIRANPKVMFGLSLLVMGVLAVIEAVVLAIFLDEAMPLLDPTASPEALATVGVGSMLGYLTATLAISFASVVLTGLLIISVSQSVLGRVISVQDLWTQAKSQVWRLIGLTLLLGLISIAVAAVLTLVLALLIGGAIASGNDGSAGVMVVLALLLMLATAVLAVFLSVRLGLAAPALMLEKTGVLTSIKRSWSLTSRNFWRIFGVLALAVIIVAVLSSILMIPVAIITALMPTSAVSGAALLVSTVLSVLISALTTPFLSAVLALVYIDVRMRKEGLDVELARAAEAA
ncbi:glycerophosphoryl diester phosphodiesterase membrane domain-containing protein [Georgenia yuyongxinii]